MSAVSAVSDWDRGIGAHLWWGWSRATAAPWHNLFCNVSTSLVRVSYSDLWRKADEMSVWASNYVEQEMTEEKQGGVGQKKHLK